MTVAVYFVRKGPNEELRYSLRSVEANLPEITDVVIVGHAEPWLRNVTVIPGNRHGNNKPRNVWGNVRIAAEHPDLPAEIVYMNDDFLITEPAAVGVYWRDTLDAHIEALQKGWWRHSLEATRDYLHALGIAQPLSYELHRPFRVVREQMAQTLAEAAHVQPLNPPQWRTLYGNQWAIGGTQDSDGKMYPRIATMPDGPWVSTTDGSFAALRDRLEAAFPQPSRWER